MHGATHIKIINVKQAKIYNHYKNKKEKLLKTNAAIWFNKMCRTQQLCPKYVHVLTVLYIYIYILNILDAF
jgi:hypothetical protein